MIEFFPIKILLSIETFGAIQQSEPIIHFPLKMQPAVIWVLLFTLTLCPICTKSSISTSSSIIVSSKDPFQ